MRLNLTLHPDINCNAITGIEAALSRDRAGTMTLRYIATGRMNGVALPSRKEPAHADNLWRHTCFELFLRAPECAAYYEFNFAPSTEWAGYRFSSYRSGMRNIGAFAPQHIDIQALPETFELTVALQLDCIPDLADADVLNLGLAAVIEETNGAASYWALAHPPGKPDFHHADCFAAQLGPGT